MNTPLESGVIFTDYDCEKYYSFTIMSELPKSLKHKLGRKGCCTVLATYNDLVLCFPDNYYNICNLVNLHTTQRVALPPTLPHHDDLDIAEVGFICEPYYKEQNDTTSRTMILDNEYRCRVVLIYEFPENSFRFCMDIFFSETGEWREFVVLCPERAIEYCSIDITEKNSYNNSGGLVYNGKLYWLGEGGIMELDPLAFDSNTSYGDLVNQGYCRFIQFQVFGNPIFEKIRLSVCRGCMCLVWFRDSDFEICELELGDDDQLDGGKWCFTLTTRRCIPLNHDTGRPWLLSLNESNEDCFYVISKSGYFGKGNMRTGVIKYNTVKRCPGLGFRDSFGAFPFVLPWWPTPVPRIKNDHKQPVPSGIDILCSLLLDP